MSRLLDEELIEAAQDVCYPDWDREDSILQLREGLRQVYEDDREESVYDSVFGNVSCFEQSRNLKLPTREFRDSPIQKKQRDRGYVDNGSDEEDNNIILSMFPKEEKLVNDTYVLIGRVYDECNVIDQKIERALSRFTSGSSSQTPEKENLSSEQIVDEAVAQNQPQLITRPVLKQSQQSNQCLRKVICPDPGRNLLRHDPVKMMQIYKEEWKRKPTPEEQKRLELRWKVREHMLRRDFPKKFPEGGIAKHNKDWSPKAYMN